MLYYVFRGIFIFLICFFIFIFVIIRNKKRYGKFFIKSVQANKTLHKRKYVKLKTVLCCILCLLLLDVVFYPFEGYFVRFSSLNQSINYSIYDCYNSEISITECDDTVFFVKNRDNNLSYHSIAKYGNSYGLCDFNTKSFIARQAFVDDYEFKGTLQVDCIQNKNTGKICYFITAFAINGDNDNLKMFDGTGKELKIIYNTSNTTVFYLITDKELTRSDYFSFLGKNYEFVNS